MKSETLTKLAEIHRLLGAILEAERPAGRLTPSEELDLKATRVIDVIKAVRARTGAPLMEAKALVELEGLRFDLCTRDSHGRIHWRHLMSP